MGLHAGRSEEVQALISRDAKFVVRLPRWGTTTHAVFQQLNGLGFANYVVLLCAANQEKQTMGRLHEALMDLDLSRVSALVAEFNVHEGSSGGITVVELAEALPSLLWLVASDEANASQAAPLHAFAAHASLARKTSECCRVLTSRLGGDAGGVPPSKVLFAPGLWEHVGEADRVHAVMALARNTHDAGFHDAFRSFLEGLGPAGLEDVCYLLGLLALHEEGVGRALAASVAFAGPCGVRALRALAAGAPVCSLDVVEGFLDAAQCCSDALAPGTEACAWLHAACGALYDLSPRHGEAILASLGSRKALPHLALRLLLLWKPAETPQWIQLHACDVDQGRDNEGGARSDWLWSSLSPADAGRLFTVSVSGANAACLAATDLLLAGPESAAGINDAVADFNRWITLLGTVMVLVRVEPSSALSSHVGALLLNLAKFLRHLQGAPLVFVSPSTLVSLSQLSVWCSVLAASFLPGEDALATGETVDPALDCLEAWLELRTSATKLAPCEVPPTEVHAIVTLCSLACGPAATARAAHDQAMLYVARDALKLPPDWKVLTFDGSVPGLGICSRLAHAAQLRWLPLDAAKLISGLPTPAPIAGAGAPSDSRGATLYAVSAALVPGGPLLLEAKFDGHQWILQTLATTAATRGDSERLIHPPPPHPQMFALLECYVECVALGAASPLLPFELSSVANSSPASAALSMFAAMKICDRTALPFDSKFFFPLGCSDLVKTAVLFWLRADPEYLARDNFLSMLSYYWPGESIVARETERGNQASSPWSDAAWSIIPRAPDDGADVHARLQLLLAAAGDSSCSIMAQGETWHFIESLLGHLVAEAPALPWGSIDALSEAWLRLASQSAGTELLLESTMNALLLKPSPPLTFAALVQEPLLVVSLPDFALQRPAALRIILVVLSSVLEASMADAMSRRGPEESEFPVQSTHAEAYCLLLECAVVRTLLGSCRSSPDPALHDLVRSWVTARQSMHPRLVQSVLSQGLALQEVAVLAFDAQVELSAALISAMNEMLHPGAPIEANLAGITVAAALSAAGCIENGAQPTLDAVSRCIVIIVTFARSVELCSSIRAVLCAALAEIDVLLSRQPLEFRQSDGIVSALQVFKGAEFSGITPAPIQGE